MGAFGKPEMMDWGANEEAWQGEHGGKGGRFGGGGDALRGTAPAYDSELYDDRRVQDEKGRAAGEPPVA